jgi:hypothetical protein
MFEWRDFLLVEGGPDRDRKVAGGIQHQAAALVAGLQAAGAGGLYSSDATKLKFTGPSCDVNSLIRRGTKTRAGQHLAFLNPLKLSPLRLRAEPNRSRNPHKAVSNLGIIR